MSLIRLIKLHIGSVDGITGWSMESAYVVDFRSFYNQFGHEGDTVTIEIWEGDDFNSLTKVKELYNEEAHKYIEENNAN